MKIHLSTPLFRAALCGLLLPLVLVITKSNEAFGQNKKKSIYASANEFSKFNVVRKKQPFQTLTIPYVEVRGGASGFNQIDQTGFEPADQPYFLAITAGRIFSPISFGLGHSRGGNSNLETFSLAADYTYGFLQLQILQAITGQPKPLEWYLMGGVNFWQAEVSYPLDGTSDFSPIESEKDNGFGSYAGMGIVYRYHSVGIGAEYQWFLGKGEFTGGAEEKSDVLTGSGQLMITASVRLVWGRKTVQCPIYSK